MVSLVLKRDRTGVSPQAQVYGGVCSALRIALILGLVGATGCHTLRSRRQTQALSDARQNSLRGAEKLQQNKLKDAGVLFAEALRNSPADERAQWGMAEVLWQEGDRDEAIQHMAEAVKISGGNPDLLVRLGEMNLQQGHLDEALSQSDLALQGQRKHSGAWALRGKVLHRRNQLEDALSCYHRSLIGQPNSPEVQLSVAEIYQTIGRPQRALGTLENMTDGQSEEQVCSKAWMLKGQALADLGESGAAKTCLRHAALCATDEETDLLLQLAESQIAAGDLAEARICLGRAFRCDPQNPNAIRIQGLLERTFQQISAHNVPVAFEQPLDK
jgi:tetratricopeptide (TPR) repeat protein